MATDGCVIAEIETYENDSRQKSEHVSVGPIVILFYRIICKYLVQSAEILCPQLINPALVGLFTWRFEEPQASSPHTVLEAVCKMASLCLLSLTY